MQVRWIDDTVTVSGASSLVDTRNVLLQNVVSREVLDVLQIGSNTPGILANVVPGLTPGPICDRGCQRGIGVYTLNLLGTMSTFHRKTGPRNQFDGFHTNMVVSICWPGRC